MGEFFLIILQKKLNKLIW